MGGGFAVELSPFRPFSSGESRARFTDELSRVLWGLQWVLRPFEPKEFGGGGGALRPSDLPAMGEPLAQGSQGGALKRLQRGLGGAPRAFWTLISQADLSGGAGTLWGGGTEKLSPQRTGEAPTPLYPKVGFWGSSQRCPTPFPEKLPVLCGDGMDGQRDAAALTDGPPVPLCRG